SLGALGIAHRHAAGAPDWAAGIESVVLISMPSGAPFLVDVFLDAMDIRPPTRACMTRLFQRRFNASVEAFAALPAVSRIGGRLLVLHDVGDDIVPCSHSEAVLREIPGATLVTTRDLG